MLPEPEVPGRWKAFLIACGSPAEDTFNEKAVWETWEQVVPFLRGELYEVGDETRFKTAINKFTKAFIACWGEGHVTHYMHILYAHGPWLIKTHGSLGVWQCQGMEKSHWVARGNWQKHTNHDGGRQQAVLPANSSLWQLFRFDYRQAQGRRREKARKRARAMVEEGTREAKERAVRRGRTWFASAIDETKAHVRNNVANARKVWERKLIVKRAEREALRSSLMKCHGVIEDHESNEPDIF